MSKINKNSLDVLFGSKLRVKVLKYLFRNYPEAFSARALARVIQESIDDVTKELNMLKSIGLVNQFKKK